MPVGKITKRSVDGLMPAKRAVYLFDSEAKGFGLKVTPKGRRVYVLKYRTKGRRRVRWHTIGRHGSPWTPESARREAIRLLGEVAAGHDPGAEKKLLAHELTIGMLCDLYLAEGVTTKKPSTVAVDESRIARHIKPLLGTRCVGEITRADIERFQLDVAEGRTAVVEKTGPRGKAIVRGGTGAARKCVNLLGSVFTFAVNRGLRPDNPAHGVRRYRERRMERFLSASEFARLGEVLADAEREGTNPSAIAAIRLLTFTGCRKSEILTLRWGYIDWERRVILLPDSKTGAKIVPLGAPALELLRRITPEKDNAYVLPGVIAGDHFKGLQKVWVRLRVRAGLQGVRLHDLRHSYASVAAARGNSLLMIGALLGHKNAATTERYAHLARDPVHAAANDVAADIANAMGISSGRTTAEIVPIRGDSA